jgi:FixJ family two-component response regulator
MTTLATVSNTTPRRYEVASLLAFSGTTSRSLAMTLCIDPVTLWRHRRRGWDLWEADRAACAVGVHPTLVWDDWLFDEDLRLEAS